MLQFKVQWMLVDFLCGRERVPVSAAHLKNKGRSEEAIRSDDGLRDNGRRSHSQIGRPSGHGGAVWATRAPTLRSMVPKWDRPLRAEQVHGRWWRRMDVPAVLASAFLEGNYMDFGSKSATAFTGHYHRARRVVASRPKPQRLTFLSV